ncbi:LTA synthase family protein [Compostibacter hankyongensis]|uniref:Alkaline phosphatase family protein n=1 Tax=Compostibacter hankyongensis TaxID=1007089 RepID=A0ABP8FZC4_9BACT
MSNHRRKHLPGYVSYVLAGFCMLYGFLVLFRLIFYLFFFTSTIHTPPVITRAWYLGLKFDLRLALIILLPVLLAALVFRQRILVQWAFRRIFSVYFFIVYAGLYLLYVTDLGYYSYLGVRMDPSVLRFLASGERTTNGRMVWETYPVIRIVLGGIIAVWAAMLLHRWYRNRLSSRRVPLGKLSFAGLCTGMILLFAAGIYGNFGYFPLRWSQAMFAGDNGIASLGLNPVLYFTGNLSVSSETYDPAATRKYYPVMARYLGVERPDSLHLDFIRQYPGRNRQGNPPNVVFVMLESCGAALTSMSGNPMQATPNLQQLAEQGLWFEHFYVPAQSTARTVFGITTGLPDVTSVKTASRNPKIVDQRVIMDQFDGYEKYYLLGGNTNWANMRAVFTNNVRGIKIYEEGDFKDAKADVWGISDYDLMGEADKVFRDAWQRGKPFVAFLQTADNHKPYTTTAGDGDFRKLTSDEVDPTRLKAAGFASLGQFNALRYLDYNIGHFMKLARKSGYLDHTIFVFFGDHNAVMDPYGFMPYPEYEMGIGSVHAACVIYGPPYVQPRKDTLPASLLDLYPTVAHMAGVPYRNYTLGIDLLDSTRTLPRYAYVSYIKNSMQYHGLIGPHFLYEINKQTKKTGLYDWQKDALKDVKNEYPDSARYLDGLTRGFFETTWYLMFNNKKHTGGDK